MKHMLVIFFCLISASASAEFDYELYKVEHFENAVSALEKDSKVDYFVETNFSKYRVQVKYTGKIRKISKESTKLIVYWGRSLKLPTEYQERFSYEIQIENGAVLYWLPIQGALVEPFSKEVKSNALVNLYIIAIGSIKLIPVFGVCEFEASQ